MNHLQRILLFVLSISFFITIAFTLDCFDYNAATQVGVGQTTISDSACVAIAQPFPTDLSIEAGLIEYDNLHLFYIPPQVGEPSYELTADTCASDFDTMMVIFVFNTATNLYQFIASNDDFCNLQSSLSIAVSDEQRVYIAVAGYDATTSGELILTISMNISAVSSIDQIRFMSEDIEEVAGKVMSMSGAIVADTSLATADTNIASIDAIKAEIQTEYGVNGLVTDMTSYVTALSASLTQLGTDATSLQTNIATRVTSDTNAYNAVVTSINSDIATLTEQATNISTALTSSSNTASTIDGQISTLKSGLDTQITSFTALNSYFSSTLGALETNSFTTFACKYLAITSTTSVPPVLMSPNAFNGKLENVATIVTTIASNLPSQNPACASYMTSYNTNLAAAMYMTAFANLQSAYQCYY